MNSHHQIETDDPKVLSRFGLVVGGLIAAIFGLLVPWLLERLGGTASVLALIIGGTLIVLGLTQPRWLALPYKLWMKLGLLLNKITNPLILGLLFFAVVLPIGAIRRLKNKDPLKLRLSSSSESYRTPSPEVSSSKEPF